VSKIASLFLVLSILGLGLILLLTLVKKRGSRTLVIQVLVLTVYALILNGVFGFTKPAHIKARGSTEEIALIGSVYLFSILGIVAQVLSTRMQLPEIDWPRFEVRSLVASVLASTIIVIPLMTVFDSESLKLGQWGGPRFVIFFVAFQNGFFWKDYFDKLSGARNQQ